jgi:hypothetical protein
MAKLCSLSEILIAEIAPLVGLAEITFTRTPIAYTLSVCRVHIPRARVNRHMPIAVDDDVPRAGIRSLDLTEGDFAAF